MVPTELLAIQHYEQIQNLLANMEAAECKLSVALLTGSTSTKESRLIRQVRNLKAVLQLFLVNWFWPPLMWGLGYL